MSTKKITRTILFTLLIMVVSTTIFVFSFTLIFPKISADFFYDIGEVNLSSKLYYNDYTRTKDINSLAYAINLSIESENNNQIIDYLEEFFNHKNYADYIEKLNNKNANYSLTPLIKSTVINEDNHYKNMYVKALIENNETTKAFNFACENLQEVEKIDDIGCYAFSWFFKNEFVYLFNENYPNSSISVGKTIEIYFYELYNFYFDNITFLNHENKPYFIALANRVDNVGRNLYYIVDSINEDINGEDILNKIYSINQSLYQLLGGA